MPRKAREILKARGYTDEELGGLALLQDARFVSALEAEDAEREKIALENTKVKADLEATTRWYNEEALPTINRLTNDATTARADKARLEAKLKAEAEYGMRKLADQDGGGGDGAGGDGADKGKGKGAGAGDDDFSRFDSRYITGETFKAAFSQTGEAIAMATDILEDHRDLFGKRLPGGVGELRSKYQKAVETGFRGNLRDYWNREYNVEAKRTELEAKDRQAQEDRIRQDERTKVLSEFGNPMTRTMSPSRSPFVRKEIKQGTVDGKQPWDRGTVEQRRSERVIKFGTKVLSGSQAS